MSRFNGERGAIQANAAAVLVAAAAGSLATAGIRPAFEPQERDFNYAATAYCPANEHAVFAKTGGLTLSFDGESMSHIGLACIGDGSGTDAPQKLLVDLRDKDTHDWAEHKVSPTDISSTLALHCTRQVSRFDWYIGGIVVPVEPAAFRVDTPDLPDAQNIYFDPGYGDNNHCTATLSQVQ